MSASLLNWMKRFRAKVPDQPVVNTEVMRRPEKTMTGKYLALYTYLENRFANIVVLTFAQIEDLLGFTLPDMARRDQEWWTNVDSPGGANHSEAWRLANRTAKVNLRAQTVVFERSS